MPQPGPNEVLVKLHYSPINVSDTAHIKGAYNAKQQEAYPCQLGFEASGVVVRSGGGLAAWRVDGKRVAVASKSGGRMWAEVWPCCAVLAGRPDCVVMLVCSVRRGLRADLRASPR